MFKFEKTLLHRDLATYCEGRIIEVNTDKGRMILDRKLLHCEPLVPFAIAGALSIPYYFVREEGIIYLMKEEPCYYV